MPASVYDEDYYREACGGYSEWVSSEGRKVWAMYPSALAKAGLQPGDAIVDFGTGRGEVLVCAIQAGASRAIGVDYSDDAVNLSLKTAQAHDLADRVEVLHRDLRDTGLEGAVADVVTMLDVVEHLSPVELRDVLLEARRILKPGGRVLIHTLPNRNIYSMTYRFQRGFLPRRRRDWPRDPRNDWERSMHVNEQTRRSLKHSLRAVNFAEVRVEYGNWIHDGFVPDERARKLYRRLAKFQITAPLGAADIWGSGLRPIPVSSASSNQIL